MGTIGSGFSPSLQTQRLQPPPGQGVQFQGAQNAQSGGTSTDFKAGLIEGLKLAQQLKGGGGGGGGGEGCGQGCDNGQNAFAPGQRLNTMM